MHFLDNIKLVVVVTVLLKYIQLGLGLWLVSFFTMILLIIFVIHIYLYWVYSFFIPRCGGTAIMFMSVSLTHGYVSCCKIVAGPTRILFPCNSILNFFLRKKKCCKHCMSWNRRRCQPHVRMFLSFSFSLFGFWG